MTELDCFCPTSSIILTISVWTQLKHINLCIYNIYTIVLYTTYNFKGIFFKCTSPIDFPQNSHSDLLEKLCVRVFVSLAFRRRVFKSFPLLLVALAWILTILLTELLRFCTTTVLFDISSILKHSIFPFLFSDKLRFSYKVRTTAVYKSGM